MKRQSPLQRTGTNARVSSAVNRMLVVLGLGSALACDDSTRATRPSIPRSTLSSAAAFAAAPAAGLPASAVSFDVTIETSTAGSPTQTSRMHIDRSRSAGNAWRTIVTLPDDPRLNKFPRAAWRLKRLIVDEGGRVTAYRADGGAMSLPDPRSLQLLPMSGPASKLPVGRPISAQTAAGTVLATGWIDRLVMSGADRAHEVAAASAGAATVSRDGHGLEHYVKTVGGNAVDVAVDPVAGYVSSTSVTGAHTVHLIANEYVTGPSGISIRRRTQTQHSSAKKSGQSTITLSSIVIDGQEVKP